MGSKFDTAITASFVDHLDAFGGPITYQAPDEDARTVTAIIGDEQRVEKHDGDTTTFVRTREVRVRADETATEGGIANPTRLATVTVDGREYVVTGVDQQGTTVVAMTIERPEMIETGRARYRK